MSLSGGACCAGRGIGHFCAGRRGWGGGGGGGGQTDELSDSQRANKIYMKNNHFLLKRTHGRTTCVSGDPGAQGGPLKGDWLRSEDRARKRRMAAPRAHFPI